MGEALSSMLETADHGAEHGEDVVLAGGGMIVRCTPERELQVAIVHRPLREDWTFPKGKTEPGETLEACALREVEEETGLRCQLRTFVGRTEYRDRKNRPKVVSYWLMEASDGQFAPGSEVDQLRWVTREGAARLLSYERDRDLLDALSTAASALFGVDVTGE